jgi:hypothetical protein
LNRGELPADDEFPVRLGDDGEDVAIDVRSNPSAAEGVWRRARDSGGERCAKAMERRANDRAR